MAELETKQLDGATGSDVAYAALLKGTLALDRIARHEETCGKRWSTVMKLLWFVTVKIFALLTFLLADKWGWLV